MPGHGFPLLEVLVLQPMLVLNVSETRYIVRSCSPLLEVLVPQPMLVLGLSETRYSSETAYVREIE